MSGSGWAIVLGIWLVATGMNYLPLAISAQSLSRPRALEAELVGADLPRELRQAGARQLWILVPLAVVIAALVQAWSRRRLRHGHRDDSGGTSSDQSPRNWTAIRGTHKAL
jgi:hypothetical protein